ncbi:MAG: hypothetical protein ACRDTE_21600, partial [Pseudonocardiaceae bacterium]
MLGWVLADHRGRDPAAVAEDVVRIDQVGGTAMLVVLTTLTAAGTRPGQRHPTHAAATCRATGDACATTRAGTHPAALSGARGAATWTAGAEARPTSGATSGAPTDTAEAAWSPAGACTAESTS